MKSSIKYLFSKCDQIRSFLRIWPNFTKETLTGKLHFLCSDYISNTIFYLPFKGTLMQI